MRLIRVDQTTIEGWTMMPICLHLIQNFCQSYPTELNARQLTELVKADFITGNSALGLWAGFDNGKVIGHLFARFDPERKVVFIYQLEAAQRLSLGLVRAGIHALETWAREQGATSIDAVTWHEPRKWRRYGFQHHRYVIRRTL